MADNRRTVFVVDDDLTSLAVAKVALKERYNALTVNSGAQLLKILEKSIPDLILLDIDMPDTDGYETIKALKSNPRTADIPVVFLTAHSNSESELRGITLGAVDYIIKPFSAPLLLKRIEMHLTVESQKNLLESQKHLLESQNQELKAQHHELEQQKQELVNFNTKLQEMVDAKVKTILELQSALLRSMAELVESRDDITGGHIERTQSYLGILLEAMKAQGIYKEEVAQWDLSLVLMSAQLHDVGKIAVKDSILNKPGKLTPEEFEEVKKHTTFGGEVIDKIMESTSEHTFLTYAKTFALTHHEKWDGTGYPNGLKSEEIPILGRLMAIADVYDALVSDRPYKRAFEHEDAVKIIREGRGTHFDPILTDMFLSISDEFGAISSALGSKSL
ncbi:MAG: response regulator [Chitinispirillales bacterium]|jgi:putative two-component system response regulator|nr:response regulator [Chitinispirillales bacterium]